MPKKQVKSKQRVADHGEVFTAKREVNAMLDLVKQETERIDSRFLEPACGDGNFIAEILKRKLYVVKTKYKKSTSDYEKNAVIAASSIYGIDILQDNVEACRERIFKIWNAEYKKSCGSEANEDCREAVKYILSKNIVCGNALTMKQVDIAGEDIDKPIIFSEWSFVTNDMVKRRDFRFDVLLKENDDENCYESQMSLFADSAMSEDNWMIDPETHESVPKPIKEFPLTSYRRIQDNG